jgi:hypothetical protein
MQLNSDLFSILIQYLILVTFSRDLILAVRDSKLLRDEVVTLDLMYVTQI